MLIMQSVISWKCYIKFTLQLNYLIHAVATTMQISIQKMSCIAEFKVMVYHYLDPACSKADNKKKKLYHIAFYTLLLRYCLYS